MSEKILVIVESPSKAKTIGKYLGSKYKVVASVGHVRDLPKSRLGIDLENNFEPEYIQIRGKGDLIKELKKEAKEAKKVYLATDPDREGEAISWHLSSLLNIDPTTNCRVTFDEITDKVVNEQIKNPRSLDLRLVDAQQARRILDRLVGYKISPLLWKKVKKGLSAGRVQSAALKMICDREKEIENFDKKEYWNIFGNYKKGKKFSLKVAEYDKKKLEVSNSSEADIVEKDLLSNDTIVSSVEKKERFRSPFAPFTTSTLQQDAANKLGFPAKKTMMVVQQLYEGIEIKGKGSNGLVTYIRTDSVRISDEAKKIAKEYIEKNIGKEYTANNVFTNKKKETQDAHEAIRPTHIDWDPELIKGSLNDDQYKLYKLIWTRFIASQMQKAVFDQTIIEATNGKYLLKTTGSILKFDGYQRIYQPNIEEDKDTVLPELTVGEKIDLVNVTKEQKFTEPPQRYTEASLIKDLEENGIGRPSTYAPIVSTLVERTYIRRQKKSLLPTELGIKVTYEVMTEFFKEIVDIDFTSQMEDNLDKIAEEGIDWRKVVSDFFTGLKKELDVAEKELGRVELTQVIAEGEFCEKCGKPMAIKYGKFGEFLACTGYPECKTTRPIVKKVDVKCPLCGGDIIARKSKKGKVFYGCSNYPTCNKAYWYKPIDKKCPVCGELLVQHKTEKGKYSCGNQECKYVE